MIAKHGGNIYEIAKKYGISEKEILDFSANINPLGIPDKLKKAIISNIDIIKNYPDPDYKDLVSAIAKHNNIDENLIIPGNGATEIIFHIIQAIKPKKALLPVPTFLEYERALKETKSHIEYCYLDENNSFQINREILLEKLREDIDFIVLCNPNNPTGQITQKEMLIEILEESREKGINIMVDEAFIEFVDDEAASSLIDCLGDFENLFIIRALTKFFAIPGLRLGYGLMSNQRIKKAIISKKQPWTINSFAAVSVDALLGDDEYIKESKEFFKLERLYMYKRLMEFKALKVFRPHANYILFKVLNGVLDLRKRLIAKKILIRNCDNYVNLDKSFFRIAIKDRASNEKLLKALREVLYEG